MELVVLGLWLDSMILRVFSNLNDSMILCPLASTVGFLFLFLSKHTSHLPPTLHSVFRFLRCLNPIYLYSCSLRSCDSSLSDS